MFILQTYLHVVLFPDQQSFDIKSSVSSFNIVQDETPLSSPLKAPAFVADSFEKKMEDAEEECNQNVRRLKARLRLTNPDGEDPGLVANFHDAWHKKLKECVANVVYAVRKLCNDFGIILGSDKVKAWKATVATCKKEFSERLKAWWVVVQHWANVLYCIVFICFYK